MLKIILSLFLIGAVHSHHHHQPKNCSLTPYVECDLSSHHLHCHWPDDDTIHLCEGETTTVKGKCIEITCLAPSKDLILSKGCENVYPKPGCSVTSQNNNLPYPDCCPEETCP